jgi:hypothetical protein
VVGGKIIDIGLGSAKMSLWVQNRFDEIQIDVEPHQRVSVGDFIWWQGRKAFLTKADRSMVDMTLNRIGYSHPPHPKDFGS